MLHGTNELINEISPDEFIEGDTAIQEEHIKYPWLKFCTRK